MAGFVRRRLLLAALLLVAAPGLPGRAEEAVTEDAAARREAEVDARDKHNSDVQEEIARATEDGVVVARWQAMISATGLLVAGIGTLGLYFSLILNRRATEAAVAAAAAAREAIGTERAWMSPIDLVQRSFSTNTEGEGIRNGLVFEYEWKNSGRSPALDVWSFVDHRVSADREAVPEFRCEPTHAKSSRIVGPDCVHRTERRILNDTETTDFIKGAVFIHYYCRIFYRDVYSPEIERFTEICGLISCRGVVASPDQKSKLDIAFLPRGPQNTAT